MVRKLVVVNIFNNKKRWALEMKGLSILHRLRFAVCVLLERKLILESSKGDLIYNTIPYDSRKKRKT